ncbi:MAG: acyl-CoA-binding protein [Bdellovibrionota bacterium]
MELGTQFQQATQDVLKLSERPSNDALLALYALYKQATDGDVSGKRPGLMDLKGRKKYDAWAGKKGMSKDAAMKEYVALVSSLQA